MSGRLMTRDPNRQSQEAMENKLRNNAEKLSLRSKILEILMINDLKITWLRLGEAV